MKDNSTQIWDGAHMLELVFEWSVKRINGQAVVLQNELETVKSTKRYELFQ